MIAGVLAPVLLLVSCSLLAVLISYTTYDNIDPREMIPHVVPCVRLLKTTKHKYWIILDQFYFRIKTVDPKDCQKQHCWYSACDKSLPTWSFTIIITVTILLAFSTFASIRLTSGVAFSSCEDVEVDTSQFTCFDAHDKWQYINCSSVEANSSSSRIVCLQFNSEETNVFLPALVASVVFYVATIQILGTTFLVAKGLLRCRLTTTWGMVSLFAGVFIELVCLVLFTLIFVLPVKYGFIEVLQVGMLGIYGIVSGVLILKSKCLPKQKEEFVSEDFSTDYKTNKASVVTEKPNLCTTETQLDGTYHELTAISRNQSEQISALVLEKESQYSDTDEL